MVLSRTPSEPPSLVHAAFPSEALFPFEVGSPSPSSTLGPSLYLTLYWSLYVVPYGTPCGILGESLSFFSESENEEASGEEVFVKRSSCFCVGCWESRRAVCGYGLDCNGAY